MEAIASSHTLSQGSAFSMAFSRPTAPTSGSSIWSTNVHADNDGFLTSSYRAGGPRLASLPATIESVHRYIQEAGLEDPRAAQHVKDLVVRVLREFRIAQQPHISLEGRMSIIKPERSPIPTILVIFTGPLPMDSSNWREVAKGIHSRLENRLQGLSVELIHKKLLCRARCFPIPRSHPIVPIWEEICHEILTRCDTLVWSGLSCWRYGVEDVLSHNPMTLIVSLLESARGSFTTSMQIISGILRMKNLNDINILFMKDEMATGVGGFDQDKLDKRACDAYAQPGVSIGICDSNAGSSTLGGLVEIKLPGSSDWHVFALTCFHCIWPPAENRLDLPRIHQQDARDALDRWEYEPVRPNNHRARQLLRVNQPSLSDVHATIQSHQNYIDDYNDDEFRLLRDKIEADEFLMPNEESKYRVRCRMISLFETEKMFFKEILEMGIELGHVYAGSGMNRVSSSNERSTQMLDWALIKLLPSRLPPRAALAKQNKPFTYVESEKLHFTGISTDYSTEETKVAKSGRSTGFTKGYLNGIKGVRLAHIRDPMGTGSRTVESFELQVTSSRQIDFSVPGDSGSFVTDMEGKVIGMLMGESRRANASCVTPLADIFEDIKRVTQAEDVRLVV